MNIRVYLLYLIVFGLTLWNLTAKAVEVDSALNKASQSLLVGNLKNVNEAETLANSVSLIEPKSKLAHWLKAQSLFIQAGVGFEIDKKDRKFVKEAKARTLTIPESKIPGNILGLTASENISEYMLLMETGSSRLFVFENDYGIPKLVKSFYSSIGLFGDRKQKEGDKKTPIGVYQIRKELDKPRADGFLGNTALTLDYPNADDKSVGRTGYGIWIHGVPSNVHVRSPRSSDGCLALANSDLAKLKKFVVMGKSQILIVPKIWWLDLEEWLIQDKMIKDLFSGVYLTSKDEISQSAKKKLIAYMRVDPLRPSVAVIQKKSSLYREYWIETENGFKLNLHERLKD
tara:strand:- start:2031 stop:3062 length:1032 start_codon:yes stop_codon:yes gene_type:complete